MNGRQLFEEWMHRDKAGPRSNGPHEYTASDGSFMLWVGLYDFDYKRGYLIEVRTGEGSGDCDWLFAWERYGGRNDFDVEWQNTPCYIFSEEHRPYSSRAMTHLPEWCLARLEEDPKLGKP